MGGPGFHSFANLFLVLITAGENFAFGGGELCHIPKSHHPFKMS